MVTFSKPQLSGWCSGTEGTWVPRDLDGDGRTDLIVTTKCEDPDIGTTHWRVYLGGGDRFTEPYIDWALPPDIANPFPALEATCGSTESPWSLLDLTGDGLDDLVLHGSCFEEDERAATWSVYENLGDGFAADPVSFTTPERYGPLPQVTDALPFGCSATYTAAYGLHDLDADGFTDLVVTRSCLTGEGDVGRARWLVHPGSASGFAEEGIEWALPTGFSRRGLPFKALAATLDCGEDSTPTYMLSDMDGDGRNDVLVANDCEESTGSDHWNVYANTGAGFNTEATPYTLPDPSEDKAYTAFLNERDCRAGTLSHVVTDLTGDLRMDMVFTADCAEDSDLGETHWDVFPGEDGGFAPEPIAWSLPDVDGTRSFGSVVMGADCAERSFDFVIAPMVGDPAPELVLTGACDGSLGSSKWLVYTPTCAD
jgi:hypothetical protein